MSVFFTSWKTDFKCWLDTSSIPPRYLTVYRASSAFSNRNPDSFSIPGGSIENGSASLIASRHLVDRPRFYSWFCWVVPRHLLDTSAVDDHFLDTYLDRFLDTSRHLHLSRFTAGTIYTSCAIPFSFQSISLSRYFSDFSAKFSHLTPLIVPQGFFKLFQAFLHLVSF